MKTAALLAALVACSDGGGAPAPDGGPADAAIDAGPGPVEVTVRGLSSFGEPQGPLAGAPVYFVGPDGAEQEVVTDAAGRAAAVIAPGTAVFVRRLREPGFAPEVAIYLDVDPGMDFTVGAPTSPSVFQVIGQAQVTLPSIPQAFAYSLTGSCIPILSRNLFDPFFFFEVRPCARVEHATLVTGAYDVDSKLIAYGVARDVDLRAATGGFNEVIEVPATLAPVPARVTFASVPPEVGEIEVLHTQRDGDVDHTILTGRVPREGSVVDLTFPIAPIGDRTVVRSLIHSIGRQYLVVNQRRTSGPRLETQIDLGASMPPFVIPPSVSTGVRTAAWTYFGGSGTPPDLMVIRGQYFNDRGAHGFALYARGDRSHATWPAFPAALATAEPPPGTFVEILNYAGVEVVGRDYGWVLATADAETRVLAEAADPYRGEADVWISSGGVF